MKPSEQPGSAGTSIEFGGRTITLDTSDAACVAFRRHAGQRVTQPIRGAGTVLGVERKEDGSTLLWVEYDTGANRFAPYTVQNVPELLLPAPNVMIGEVIALLDPKSSLGGNASPDIMAPVVAAIRRRNAAEVADAVLHARAAIAAAGILPPAAGATAPPSGSPGPVTRRAAPPLAPRKPRAPREAPPAPRPIEYDEAAGKLYILEAVLDAKRRPTPEEMEAFSHFTLDERTLLTLEKIATAVALRSPCLLEGETSTSKTSSIEYLAMLAGNRVLRINLNGQTDTSELIGKYVPYDPSDPETLSQAQIEFEKAILNPHLLTAESQNILQESNRRGDGLQLMEAQKIAALEGIKTPDWRWKHGIIPKGLLEGYWIIIDEINLAEPQILERMNPVLERNPSITLSENGGMKIGRGGDAEVHGDARIFATMNPADYDGRKPMSLAFKDRWLAYMYVENPSERDYKAMMQLLVYGEQPEVTVRGQKYRGEKVEALYPELQKVQNLRTLLPKVAKFHAKLEEMARKREIGKGKKEPYVFTRRGLLEFFSFLESKEIVDRATKTGRSILDDPQEIVLRAIEYYYIDKISNADDRRKLVDLLKLMKLDRSNLEHVFFDRKFDDRNGKPLWVGEQRESGVYGIGDELTLRDPDHEDDDLAVANRIRIMAFTPKGEAILQLDGTTYLRMPQERLAAEFAKKEEEVLAPSETPLRTSFRSTSDKRIDATGEREKFGYKVGERLRVSDPGFHKARKILNAKRIEVVGFTEDKIIIEIDGSTVFQLTGPSTDAGYLRVTPRTAADFPRAASVTVFDPGGHNHFGKTGRILTADDDEAAVEVEGHSHVYPLAFLEPKTRAEEG